MGVRVDKAGTDDEVRGVDHAAGGSLDVAGFDDPSAADGDVAPVRRATGSVHDSSVFDEQIVSHRGTLLFSWSLRARSAQSQASRSGKSRRPSPSYARNLKRRRIEIMAGLLEGKCTLITGAGTGIGRGAALCFARHGAKVAAVDIVPQTGEETVRMIKAEGGDA